MQPSFTVGKFRFTQTGVEIRDEPGLEEWAGPLQFALWCQRAAPWWIGDLLNAGDAQFGEDFSQACCGAVSADQLQRYESVARRVPPANRRPTLSWSAHAAVARLSPERQRQMLAQAEEHGWTSAVLLEKVRAAGK